MSDIVRFDLSKDDYAHMWREGCDERGELRTENAALRAKVEALETCHDKIATALGWSEREQLTKHSFVLQQLATLQAERDRLREALAKERLDMKRFEQAPCYLCGYNGHSYYQPKVHSCATRYHALRGEGG